MKVTVIANISANGRILISDNPHHKLPPEAMEFYIQFVRQVGNVVIGLKTFENFLNFPDQVKEMFKKEFSTNDIWKHFDAVKNNRVYDLEEIPFGITASIKADDALVQLYDILYNK